MHKDIKPYKTNLSAKTLSEIYLATNDISAHILIKIRKLKAVSLVLFLMNYLTKYRKF